MGFDSSSSEAGEDVGISIPFAISYFSDEVIFAGISTGCIPPYTDTLFAGYFAFPVSEDRNKTMIKTL